MEPIPIIRKALPVFTLACRCYELLLSVLYIWRYYSWPEVHLSWVPGWDTCGSSEVTHCIEAALDPEQT